MKFVQHIIYGRNWELIFDGHVIEGSVVNANVPCAIFFLTNNTGVEKGLELDLISPNFSMSCTCFSILAF